MTATAAVAAYAAGQESEAKLLEEIADLREREQAAVAKAVADDPGKSAYRPNSPAELLRRKREAAERRLADLREFEMPARQRLAQEAQTRQRTAEIERAKTKARQFDAAEEKALDRAAAAFAEFAAAWNDLHAAACQREQLAAALGAQGFAPGGDPESASRLAEFRKPFLSTVVPFPQTAEVLFNSAVLAVTDSHADSPMFATVNPDAVAFVERLREVRESRLVAGASLTLTPVRSRFKAAEFAPSVRGEVRSFEESA